MASKKLALTERVDNLDLEYLGILTNQADAEDRLDGLETEQSQTTENMVKMQDQVESMIAIAENLKAETAVVVKLSKAMDRHQVKEAVAEFIKERTAKRVKDFFVSVGYMTAIVAVSIGMAAFLNAAFA